MYCVSPSVPRCEDSILYEHKGKANFKKGAWSAEWRADSAVLRVACCVKYLAACDPGCLTQHATRDTQYAPPVAKAD